MKKKIESEKIERITLKHIFHELKQQRREIMAAIDNLNTAVSGLQTTVTAVQNAIVALKAVPNNDVAIQTAADNIAAATSTLNQSIQ